MLCVFQYKIKKLTRNDHGFGTTLHQHFEYLHHGTPGRILFVQNMGLKSPPNEQMQCGVSIHILHQGSPWSSAGSIQLFIDLQQGGNGFGSYGFTHNGFVDRCSPGIQRVAYLFRGRVQQGLDTREGCPVPTRQGQGTRILRCGRFFGMGTDTIQGTVPVVYFQ